MNRLSRSTALKIAAIIMVLVSLNDIIVYALPGLISGQEAVDAAAISNNGPPFFIVVATFVIDVLALVAAYGAWTKQRWGVVLLIITAALTALPCLAGMILTPDLTSRIMSGATIVFCASIITLCLWRERRPADSGATSGATVPTAN